MLPIVLVGPRGVRLRCLVAQTRLDRVRGLTPRARLDADAALLFRHASSVHTFGMRFPLLVVRLDEELRVVDARRVPPRRLVLPIRRARHVLECAERTDLRIGDRLRVWSGPGAQPTIARRSASAIVEASASASGRAGSVRRDQAGSATGSRRVRSGSTIPRNSSSVRTMKASARGSTV